MVLGHSYPNNASVNLMFICGFNRYINPTKLAARKSISDLPTKQSGADSIRLHR